jgi:hypothetical protein
MNFIEQHTCDVTYCTNNVENWFVQGAVPLSLPGSGWSSSGVLVMQRGLEAALSGGAHRATPSFLVTASCEEGVVGGLIMLPLCVQNTWQACLEKWFQSQLPLAVVQERC